MSCCPWTSNRTWGYDAHCLVICPFTNIHLNYLSRCCFYWFLLLLYVILWWKFPIALSPLAEHDTCDLTLTLETSYVCSVLSYVYVSVYDTCKYRTYNVCCTDLFWLIALEWRFAPFSLQPTESTMSWLLCVCVFNEHWSLLAKAFPFNKRRSEPPSPWVVKSRTESRTNEIRTCDGWTSGLYTHTGVQDKKQQRWSLNLQESTNKQRSGRHILFDWQVV